MVPPGHEAKLEREEEKGFRTIQKEYQLSVGTKSIKKIILAASSVLKIIDLTIQNLSPLAQPTPILFAISDSKYHFLQ